MIKATVLCFNKPIRIKNIDWFSKAPMVIHYSHQPYSWKCWYIPTSVNHFLKMFHQSLTLTSSTIIRLSSPSCFNIMPFSSSPAFACRSCFTVFHPGKVRSSHICQWKFIGAVRTTMKANWKKRTRSKTKGLDSFHAFNRCAMTLEQLSMARADRHATAMGGSFIVAAGISSKRGAVSRNSEVVKAT